MGKSLRRRSTAGLAEFFNMNSTIYRGFFSTIAWKRTLVSKLCQGWRGWRKFSARNKALPSRRNALLTGAGQFEQKTNNNISFFFTCKVHLCLSTHAWRCITKGEGDEGGAAGGPTRQRRGPLGSAGVLFLDLAAVDLPLLLPPLLLLLPLCV